MAKSIKLKDNFFVDSSGIVHNRVSLKTILTNLLTPLQLTLTMASGASINSGYTNGIVKSVDGIVTINIRVTKATTTTGYTHLFTLPVGSRPKALMLFPYINENGNIGFAYIDEAGNCYVYITNTAFTNSAINVSFSTIV